MEEEEFFRLLTPQSLVQIDERIAEEKAFKKAEKQAHEEGEEEELAAHEEEEPKPNPKFEAGKKLPLSLKDLFPVEYTSKPLEDFDEFYDTQKVRALESQEIVRFGCHLCVVVFFNFGFSIFGEKEQWTNTFCLNIKHTRLWASFSISLRFEILVVITVILHINNFLNKLIGFRML